MINQHSREFREMVAGPDESQRAQVMLLGTFHFANPGLDAHKPKYTFDVFSAEGQKQLADLLDRVATFRPTKILVERSPQYQSQIDEWYTSYKEGKQNDVSNEIVTIGFALAKRLGHEKVYGFDANPEWLATMPETPEAFVAAAKRIGAEVAIDDPIYNRFSEMYKAKDEVENTWTLRQRLRYLNSEEYLRLSHGAYFYFAGFRASNGVEFPGPDGFASAWHNRNLRMYSNIQRLASEPSDRLLVIVGAGHVPIIRFCAQSDPIIKLVEADTVLAPVAPQAKK